MADFTSDLHTFRSLFPFLDIDHPATIEPINHFTDINHTNLTAFMPFSNDNFLAQQPAPEFPPNLAENFPGIFHHNRNNNNNSNIELPLASHQAIPSVVNCNDPSDESKKRKTMDVVSESSSMNSSPQVSESGIKRKNNSQNCRRGKRVKSNDDEEKPKEVVHVRARRGQATDSHSLAERVRRGKINERLKCLQDIVPGCYKTMGMAVMLDEIINYVQSLQNQVEFLSMKLTAASAFYDFNSESDALETMQRAKAKEAKELERVVREGYGGVGSFHSTWSL